MEGFGGFHRNQAYGCYLAAVAFASAGSGLHHKICHVLGGRFDLPHAATHAIVLPYVLAFNAPAAPDAAIRIAGALGAADARDRPAGRGAEPARAAGAEGRRPAARRTCPRRSRAVLPAVPPADPRPVDAGALTRLLRAAWAGGATRGS